MQLSQVWTNDAPAAIGPYSQAIVVGNFVYCSGQVGIDPTSGQIEADDVQGQTTQAIHNLRAVLKAAGTDLTNVVKATVFLTTMDNFQEMNAVYGSIFSAVSAVPPARSTVAVLELPRGALVEIEAIAVIP